MSSLSKPQIALVGFGGWGKNIARTLNDLGALKTVVDTGYVPGQAVPGLAASFATLDTMLADDTITGVAIATPTPTHFDVAKVALQAGKHVFLEKPFVADKDQLNQLAALQGDRVLMVGHLMIYHPAFLKMKAMCQAGDIGQIIKIETYRKNFGKVHAHEGVVWDIGPHDFSMVYHLMQKKPHRILATSLSYIHPHHADTATVVLDYGSAQAETQLSRIHPTKEQKVVVMGTKGALVLDDTAVWPKKLVHYPHTVICGDSALQRAEGQPVSLEY